MKEKTTWTYGQLQMNTEKIYSNFGRDPIYGLVLFSSPHQEGLRRTLGFNPLPCIPAQSTKK